MLNLGSYWNFTPRTLAFSPQRDLPYESLRICYIHDSKEFLCLWFFPGLFGYLIGVWWKLICLLFAIFQVYFLFLSILQMSQIVFSHSLVSVLNKKTIRNHSVDLPPPTLLICFPLLFAPFDILRYNMILDLKLVYQHHEPFFKFLFSGEEPSLLHQVGRGLCVSRAHIKLFSVDPWVPPTQQHPLQPWGQATDQEHHLPCRQGCGGRPDDPGETTDEQRIPAVTGNVVGIIASSRNNLFHRPEDSERREGTFPFWIIPKGPLRLWVQTRLQTSTSCIPIRGPSRLERGVDIFDLDGGGGEMRGVH